MRCIVDKCEQSLLEGEVICDYHSKRRLNFIERLLNYLFLLFNS